MMRGATLPLLPPSPTRGDQCPWEPFSHPGCYPTPSPPSTNNKPGQVSNQWPMELDKAWEAKTYHLWELLGDLGVLVVMGWEATVWAATVWVAMD